MNTIYMNIYMNTKYDFFRFSLIDIHIFIYTYIHIYIIYLSHSIEIISQNKVINNIIDIQI